MDVIHGCVHMICTYELYVWCVNMICLVLGLFFFFVSLARPQHLCSRARCDGHWSTNLARLSCRWMRPMAGWRCVMVASHGRTSSLSASGSSRSIPGRRCRGRRSSGCGNADMRTCGIPAWMRWPGGPASSSSLRRSRLPWTPRRLRRQRARCRSLAFEVS